MEEPVLGVSHTWNRTPCGFLCLVPSLSIVDSESIHGATCVGTSLPWRPLWIFFRGRVLAPSSLFVPRARVSLSSPSFCPGGHREGWTVGTQKMSIQALPNSRLKVKNPCFSTLTLSIKCVGFPLHPNNLVILPSQLGVLQFSPLLTLPTWRWHQTPQVRGWFRPDCLHIRCQSQVQPSRTSHWPAAKCRLPQPPPWLAQTPRTQEIHLLR